uniref:Putative LOC100903547 [Metaseiulus occidentalis] n=1 Tax=Lepeophtheirus salmonis TaxID=72036 RepID=A0A0K2UH93_LEPSM
MGYAKKKRIDGWFAAND